LKIIAFINLPHVDELRDSTAGRRLQVMLLDYVHGIKFFNLSEKPYYKSKPDKLYVYDIIEREKPKMIIFFGSDAHKVVYGMKSQIDTKGMFFWFCQHPTRPDGDFRKLKEEGLRIIAEISILTIEEHNTII